jgi:hypothetical protein
VLGAGELFHQAILPIQMVLHGGRFGGVKTRRVWQLGLDPVVRKDTGDRLASCAVLKQSYRFGWEIVINL